MVSTSEGSNHVGEATAMDGDGVGLRDALCGFNSIVAKYGYSSHSTNVSKTEVE